MDELFLLEDGGDYFDLPCCEPEPVYYEPVPVFEPAPVYIAPEPVYVPPPTPEPVYVAPLEPIYQQPIYQEPIYQAPEPVYFELPYVEPAPVFEPIEEDFFALPYVEPESVFAPTPIFQPEPIAYIEPFSPIAAPISDQFVYIEPEPIYFEPEPIFEEQFFGLPYEGFEPEPIFTPEPIVAEETFFALPVPPEPEPVIASVLPGYVGCFTDTNNRDLSYWAPISGPLTVEGCKSVCAAAGYPYAGLQYSGECFCGDSYGRYGPAINCNMPCSGDPNQICGGAWANSIYATPYVQPEPIIEEQFFALPPPPEPVFIAEPEAFIAPVAPESPPENFFRCRPCTDGGASGFNGWGGAYG